MLEAQRNRPKDRQPYRYDEEAARSGGSPGGERGQVRASAQRGASFYDRVMEFHSVRRQRTRTD